MHSKGYHKENKKTTYGLGENIYKKWTDTGVNFQNMQTAHAAQYQKNDNNKQPNQKT